jgi:hypothetical protein
MKRNKISTAIIALAAGVSMQACASMPDTLIWKNDETGPKQGKQARVEKSSEITPSGLEAEKVNPIAPEDSVMTALTRPKVVKVEESASAGARQYFDVIDERAQGSLAPVIDAGAKPIRTVTYDNNAVQKDYPIRFGVAWNRVIEAFLDTPLDTIDRSSGVIVTGWIYDERKDAGGGMALGVLGGSDARVRYKYTVRALDRGNVTQIKVVPFVEVIHGQRWEGARPSLRVTNRMFERIERELAVPLPSE